MPKRLIRLRLALPARSVKNVVMQKHPRPPSASVILPKPLVESWEANVLSLARLPRGTSRDTHPGTRLAAVIRQEKRVILDLWEIFTQERGELSKRLLSGKREVVAYLTGFHLANAARAQLLLDRLTSRAPAIGAALAGGGGGSGAIRVHDLGCGTGAFALTLAQQLTGAWRIAPQRLEVHLTDLSGGLLDAAKGGFVALGLDGLAPPRTHKVGLERLPLDKLAHGDDRTLTSIYSLGYVWNETERNGAARARLRSLFTAHAERGDRALLLVLEPASQHIARAAQTLRDELAGAGWIPLYPCPAATPCPMLERTRDWCFSEGTWRQPQTAIALDRSLGLDRARLVTACYAFATPALAADAAFDAKALAGGVVVGRPERGGKGSGKASGKSPRGSKANDAEFDYLLCVPGDLNKAAPEPGNIVLPRGAVLTARQSDAKRPK
jgi:hypothetical protein